MSHIQPSLTIPNVCLWTALNFREAGARFPKWIIFWIVRSRNCRRWWRRPWDCSCCRLRSKKPCKSNKKFLNRRILRETCGKVRCPNDTQASGTIIRKDVQKISPENWVNYMRVELFTMGGEGGILNFAQSGHSNLENRSEISNHKFDGNIEIKWQVQNKNVREFSELFTNEISAIAA